MGALKPLNKIVFAFFSKNSILEMLSYFKFSLSKKNFVPVRPVQLGVLDSISSFHFLVYNPDKDSEQAKCIKQETTSLKNIYLKLDKRKLNRSLLYHVSNQILGGLPRPPFHGQRLAYLKRFNIVQLDFPKVLLNVNFITALPVAVNIQFLYIIKNKKRQLKKISKNIQASLLITAHF